MILPFLFLGLAASTSPVCTRQTAVPAAIEAVQTRFDAWRGRCVRLRGLLVAGNLYVDRQAPLDPIPLRWDSPTHSILVFPRGRPKPRPAEWVEVVGRIGSCADQNEVLRRWINAHPDGGIWMISGYCHVSMDNFIDPASIRHLGREPVPRLTEAEVPAERRQLVDAPPSIAGRAENEAAARALEAAIASADETAFLRYGHPETQYELDQLQGARPPRWLREDLAKAHAEFLAAIRGSLRTLGALEGRQERILVAPSALADLGEDPDYLICWCRERDCTGRWPVDRRDADNDPSRPYACVETSRYLVPGEGEKLQATANFKSGGFAEPAWPRPAE